MHAEVTVVRRTPERPGRGSRGERVDRTRRTSSCDSQNCCAPSRTEPSATTTRQESGASATARGLRRWAAVGTRDQRQCVDSAQQAAAREGSVMRRSGNTGRRSARPSFDANVADAVSGRGSVFGTRLDSNGVVLACHPARTAGWNLVRRWRANPERTSLEELRRDLLVHRKGDNGFQACFNAQVACGQQCETNPCHNTRSGRARSIPPEPSWTLLDLLA